MNFIPHVFLEIFKDMQTFYFGYLDISDFLAMHIQTDSINL